MDELKKFRETLGFSSQDMACQLNVSKSLYEKIELGQRNASSNFLMRLKTRFPQFDINVFFNHKSH